MTEARIITFVGPMHPYRGGIAQFGETLYRGLGARAHTTYAVTFSRQYPGLFFPGKTQLETEPVENPVPARRLIDSVNPWTWRRAADAIAAQNPDAVVFQFWMPFFGPAFGFMARRLRRRGVKIFAVVHNAVPHERRPGDRLLAKYFLSQCHGCIVLSEAVENDLRGLGITVPVERVVHPVYDIFGEAVDQSQARQQFGLPPEAKVGLFFGFIRKYKGLMVLLQALNTVRDALPDFRLLVAGEFYDDDKPYRDYVAERGLDDIVHFHDRYIAGAEVAAYFSAADVVIQPYLTATQSGVAQVAFHFNKPCIVSAVGGLPEIIPHEQAGLIVPPNDAPALAREIIRFYETNLGPGLTGGVQRLKAKYSWDTVYDIIERWI